MTLKKLIIALSLMAIASGANADRLVIKGSDTLGAKLVPQLAEAFKSTRVTLPQAPIPSLKNSR